MAKLPTFEELAQELAYEDKTLREWIEIIKAQPAHGTDSISRAQAIEVVQNRHMMLSKEKVLLINDLEKLPSAQLATDKNVGAKLGTNLAEVGTDLISRQALLDKFEPWLKVKDYNDGELNMLKAILYEIRFMRSAQPEIIRCKDCKHWMPYEWMFSEVWQSQNIDDYPEDEIGCNISDMSMKANDFCSRAEKREETT